MIGQFVDNVSHRKLRSFSEIDSILNEDLSAIEVVSVDCFDTIVWRKLDKPSDLFFMLQESDLFKHHSVTAHNRAAAEKNARNISFIKNNSREVSIYQIYEVLFGDNNVSLISKFVELEIAYEVKVQYSPTIAVNLLREFIRLGKKIVISSDTYYSKNQISFFLKHCLPEDVFTKLADIYTSSDCLVDKRNGLLGKVCQSLSVHPSRVLHLGDSEEADSKGAVYSSVNSFQFPLFDPDIAQMIRMSNIGISLLDPQIRKSSPMISPFKNLFAMLAGPLREDQLIGYVGLGPILFSFARYILNEYSNLKHKYPGLKLLYLLRDGYLPGEACHILAEEVIGFNVRISRFSAYAASFRSKNDIVQYVAKVIKGGRYNDMLKQLLLGDDDLSADKVKIGSHEDMIDYVLSDSVVEKIIERSKCYMARLFKYLENTCDLSRGDTILLIDLGYSATTQEQLSRVFSEEYNVNIFGRYLICLDVISQCRDRKSGLLSIESVSNESMHTLVAYIAMLEQLCTTTDSSVVDFDEDGNPVLGDSLLSQEQYDKLNNIQSACRRFCYDAKKQSDDFTRQDLARVVLAWLSRLLFFPSRNEMNYLSSFKFDLNLGTSSTYEMINIHKSLDFIQKYGLFNEDKRSADFRTNYPAELRYFGLELPIFIMNQHIHSFDVSPVDLSFHQCNMDIMIIADAKPSIYTLASTATYNGYFSLLVPVHRRITHLSFMPSKQMRGLQIHSIYGVSDPESKREINLEAALMFDNISNIGNQYYCNDDGAMISIIIDPAWNLSAITLVYKPIE